MIRTKYNVRVWKWAKKNTLPEQGSVELARACVSTFQSIAKRVQGRGIDADGVPFAPYSEKWPALLWQWIGGKRVRKGFLIPTRGDKRFGVPVGGTLWGKAGKYMYFDSYADFRRKQGLPADRKRFSLSGQTWASRVITVRPRTHREIQARLTFAGSCTPALVRSQDWVQQMRAIAKAGGMRERTYAVRGKPGERVTRRVRIIQRVARPAVKAGAQFVGGKLIRFLEVSEAEAVAIVVRVQRMLRRVLRPDIVEVTHEQARAA